MNGYKHLNRFHTTLFVICTIMLLIMSNFIILQSTSVGKKKTIFSNGNQEWTISLPENGGINDTIKISIAQDTKITSARFNVTTIPVSGQYPSNVFLDVGMDDDFEWAFGGVGYGDMGCQTVFNNSASLIDDYLLDSSDQISSNIKIPKSANINSAQLNISGSYYEYIKTTRLSSTVGAIYNCEVGDIDGDNDLDVIVTNRNQTSPFTPELHWFENTAGNGNSWSLHNIANTGLSYPYGLAVGDLDGDFDLDIVVSDNTWNSRDILWYNNTNGLGTSWTVHSVRSSIPGTSVWIYNLALADMNNDT